jgi:hypothetical protein
MPKPTPIYPVSAQELYYNKTHASVEFRPERLK